jgi:hypothetical protein
MKWVMEGAVLAAHVAAVRGVPVDYSAYLRRGSECVFVGDAVKDAVTLLALGVRLPAALNYE